MTFWHKALMRAGKSLKEASEAIDKILEAQQDKCSDCVFWKTNKCSHRADQDILFATDNACNEGFLVHFLNGQVIMKRGKTQLSKSIQYLTSQNAKDELANTFGLLPDEVEWTIRRILEKRQIKKRAYEKQQQSIGAVLEDGRVFEQITNQRFALYQDEQVRYIRTVEVYVPYKRVPWSLATEATPYESAEHLFEDVRDCIMTHLDHPNKATYNVLASWAMATWLQEKWRSVPYLQFYGPFESGKTRALEILSQLSFRAWLSLYTTSANLYRPLQQWHPTLFLDESEVYGDRNEILAILNAGYRRGQYVARQVEDKEHGFRTEFFDVFGFKALASTETFAQTLVSRCITFKMSKATRPVKLFIDEDQTQKLRNQLLMWRFETLSGGNVGEHE